MAINWTAIRNETLGNVNRQLLPPHIQLPCLPRALTEFCQRSEDPNITPALLAKGIETDSGLTAELLKFVNSASMGLRNKAGTVAQALTLLGIRKAKIQLLTVGTKMGLVARESKLLNLKNFWNANLERALFAREVALLLKADPDVAFAGGMLQDFLLPVVTNELMDTYLQFLSGQTSSPIELVRFEQAKLGWDHALAGASLMKDWAFPDDLACCILFHHRGLEMLCHPVLGKTAVAAVAASSLIPDALNQSPFGFEMLLKLEHVWPTFSLEQIVERVTAQFQEQAPGSNHQLSLLHHYQRAAASRQPVAATA